MTTNHDAPELALERQREDHLSNRKEGSIMTQHNIDSATTSRSVTAGAFPLRKIVQRTHGNRDGPITRLMSPGDLGEVLKPFVFLDLFDMEKTSFPGLGLHPHSGIATVSYLFEGDVRYEDTSGATGILTKGGVEQQHRNEDSESP